MRRVLFEEMMDGINIDRITRDYKYSMPSRHVHDEYEIYYLMEGERYYFIETQTYHIRHGSLVFVKRREIHKTAQTGAPYHDRILIELKEEPFSSFLACTGELTLKDFFSKYSGVMELDKKSQKYVESLLLSIAEELHKKVNGYKLLAMSRLACLLFFAQRRLEEHKSDVKPVVSTTARHRTVAEAASFIVENYARISSLDDIAGHLYVNKCYLSRIFKEVTGFTLSEYININRIKQAQKLLAESPMNISEISDALGYDSITYFEKVFKKYTETTPRHYRRQAQPSTQPVRHKTYAAEIFETESEPRS